MPEIIDIFNDDAFSVANLSRGFSEIDHVPDRAGILAFSGVQEGETTTTVAVEVDPQTFGVIPTRTRGEPANRGDRDRSKLIDLPIPHIPEEAMIGAEELLAMRRFGEVTVETVQNVVTRRMERLAGRHDMTLENLRLGALMGQIRDADGSILVDLFERFGISEPSAVDFALSTADTEVETVCREVTRTMRKAAKMALPSSAYVHCFCGDGFFDKLITHEEVKLDKRANEDAAARKLGEDFAYGSQMIGGVLFENYRGSDDADGSSNTTAGGAVGVASDEARFFWAGAPGMYLEALAPGNFLDAVVEVGLPRYARTHVDPRGKFVELMTEQNPLPICLRPATLLKGTA